MKTKITLALIIIFGLSLLGLSSCLGGGGANTGFQIVFLSGFMNEDEINSYGEYLFDLMPELHVAGRDPRFTPMLMGRNAMGDPQMAMGMAIRLSGMFATAEVDVVLASMDNANNMAQGGSLMPLSNFLTEAEMRTLGDRILTFELLSYNQYDQQVPSGEITPPLGFSVTDNEHIRAIFSGQEIGIFIIMNSRNLELAKEVVRTFL